MKAGELRKRIKVLRKKDQKGPFVNVEEENISYEFLFEIWAKKEDKVNEERWASNAFNAIDKKQLIVRYRTDIDETLKIELDGKIFDVLATADLDIKNQWTIILIGKVTNSGI